MIDHKTLLTGLAILLILGAPSAPAATKDEPAPLRTTLRMFQEIYESGDVVRGAAGGRRMPRFDAAP